MTHQQPGTSRTRHAGILAASIVGLTLLCSVFFPAVPIFLGVLLIVTVVLYAAPDLRPYVQSLLLIPVARPGERRARLSLTAGAGAFLIVSGAVGATTRGHLRSEWEQREVAQEGAIELLERAKNLIAAGDVEGAEFVLLDADAIAAMDSEGREEIDDLLERVRRSGDSRAILDILTELPQEEFEAFEEGAIPEALEFRERALTARAVELALAQLEEAQRVRARR